MAKFTFHYLWHWTLKSDPESLWPYVSDTDRFRAVTAFPAANYTEEPLPEGGSRRIGRFRMYGFPLVWEEQPLEWIYGKEFSERQFYKVGPLSLLRVHARLEPRADGGTELYYEIWATVGNILGYAGIPVQIGLLLNRLFDRAYRRIDAFIQSQAPQPFQTQQTPIGPAGRARLNDIETQLVEIGCEPELVSQLIAHLRTAPDDQLVRMRPYAFAEQWHADRFSTLEMFLQASKLGLLDLSWDMICPMCRGAKRRVSHLESVSHDAHCPTCNINYEVDFARSIEATFRVNPAIKAAQYFEYCAGSPRNTPHVLAQQILAPGEARKITIDLEDGRYRLTTPGKAPQTPITIESMMQMSEGQTFLQVGHDSNAHEAEFVIHDKDVHLDPDSVAEGEVTLTLKNETSQPHRIVIAHTNWSEHASTAAEVTSLQAFRDLFSSEALRPGESISVESLAVMFTDLKSSTSMYQTLGDASAFGRVMDHFKILRERVSQHHGGLIKTIGDAIMAAFPDPVNAVSAAIDILKDFQEYNAANPTHPLIIKMGVNQGACIAVTLNERLDYFGSMVNLAARLESQSQGNDVVLSQAIITDPVVMGFLNQHGFKVETFTTNLKGFSESFELHRLRLEQPIPSQELQAR